MSPPIRPLGEGSGGQLPPVDATSAIVVYWRVRPTEPTGRKSKRTRPATWSAQAITFAALRPDQESRAPGSSAELQHMVLQAYAIAACHHPIPSDAEVCYEVRA